MKHGFVGKVQDWPHSSFHRDVWRSLFPLDRAGDADARASLARRNARVVGQELVD
ncbi:hypothetical protein V4R08_00150 [Nitrobacter sp. NHB1]